VGHHEQTDLSRLWAKGQGQLLGTHCRLTLAFVCRCNVSFRTSSAEVVKKVVKNLIDFLHPKFGGRPKTFLGQLQIDPTSDLLAKFG